jgi:uncharacterized protein (TIGR02145 family)
LFEVTGKYRNEITGKKSSEELTLHALTNLKDRKNVNINVLTELEYERLMYLVTEKGKKFADAKERAEKEVLAAFGIEGNFGNSEDLTIFESGDGNAALLAVSVLMQAKTDDAGLATRIEKFADSFAETGKWNDDKTKATIEEWQVVATADGTLDSIRKNVESWGYADVVPAFEKYVEAFGDTVILSSDSESSSSVTPKSSDSETSVSSSSLKPDEPAEGSFTDSRDGKTYKTVKIGNQIWMAENLNFETAASSCYNDSSKYCDKYGRLYTWATAVGKSEEECGLGKECNLPSGNVRGVCPDGWYLPSEADFATLIKVMGGKKDAGTKLKSTSGWNDDDGESGNGTDSFGFSALAAGIGNAGVYGGVGYTTSFWGSTECGSEFASETGDGCAYAMYLDYDDVNVNLMSYAAKDLVHSVRCVKGDPSTAPVRPSSSSSVDETKSSSSGTSVSSSSVTSVSSSSVPEGYVDPLTVVTGTMTDTRDGQMYKTVKIGTQTWMAENLNLKTESSSCYNDFAENCAKYGRLYTWAAAMDSVGTWTANGKGCGLGSTCSPTDPVRGVCPSGWHLPTSAEWNILFTEVGGDSVAAKVLKSASGWDDSGNGTDDFGFSALPAGYSNGGTYSHNGSRASFWSSSEYESYRSYYVYMEKDEANILNYYKDLGLSVRCVKD